MIEVVRPAAPGKVWKVKIAVEMNHKNEKANFNGTYDITAPEDASGKSLVASFLNHLANSDVFQQMPQDDNAGQIESHLVA